MNVVGLDLSLTGTGCTRFNVIDGTVRSGNLATLPKDGSRVDRALLIAQRIMRRTTPEDLFLLEDYAYQMGPQTSRLVDLAELGGIVKLFIKRRTGFEPMEISSSSVKAWFRNGNMKKEMIPVEAYKKLGEEYKTHDEYVSAGLADMGWHILELAPRRGEVFKYEEKIMRKIIEKYPGHVSYFRETAGEAGKELDDGED